jgi:hypothetical protein
MKRPGIAQRKLCAAAGKAWKRLKASDRDAYQIEPQQKADGEGAVASGPHCEASPELHMPQQGERLKLRPVQGAAHLQGPPKSPAWGLRAAFGIVPSLQAAPLASVGGHPTTVSAASAASVARQTSLSSVEAQPSVADPVGMDWLDGACLPEVQDLLDSIVT